MNNKIGIPSIILATIITALSFYFIGKTIPVWIQMVVGFLALIQVILSSLHTLLKYNEKAEKHHIAASNYSAIRRRIEQVLSLPTNLEEAMNEIRLEIDRTSKEAPAAKGKVWKKTQKAYGGHGTADGEILTLAEQVSTNK